MKFPTYLWRWRSWPDRSAAQKAPFRRQVPHGPHGRRGQPVRAVRHVLFFASQDRRHVKPQTAAARLARRAGVRVPGGRTRRKTGRLSARPGGLSNSLFHRRSKFSKPVFRTGGSRWAGIFPPEKELLRRRTGPRQGNVTRYGGKKTAQAARSGCEDRFLESKTRGTPPGFLS